MSKNKISLETIYEAIANPEHFTEKEKAAINAQMRINHRKKLRKSRISAISVWLKNNLIALLALVISIASFIKSFF